MSSPLIETGTYTSVWALHVRRRLNLGQELERNIRHANEHDDGARRVTGPVVVQRNRPNEQVEDTAPEEAEVEGREARHPRRDLELEQRGRETEDDDVGSNDESVAVNVQVSACAWEGVGCTRMPQ